ncbi:hypothetical protein Jann_2897 [Jannaschia sp. CCS1]|nr:hypothetical protein Jann_2897 [Jannaschia sp. CCS1]
MPASMGFLASRSRDLCGVAAFQMEECHHIGGVGLKPAEQSVRSQIGRRLLGATQNAGFGVSTTMNSATDKLPRQVIEARTR